MIPKTRPTTAMMIAVLDLAGRGSPSSLEAMAKPILMIPKAILKGTPSNDSIKRLLMWAVIARKSAMVDSFFMKQIIA